MMTIGRRILWGFAAASILTLALGMIGFLSLGRVSRSFEESIATETQFRNPAYDALLATRGANVQYLRFLVEGDANYLASRDSAMAVADSIVGEIVATDPDPVLQNTLEEATTVMRDWAVEIDSSVVALQAGDRELAMELRRSRVQPMRALMDARFEEALAIASESAARASEDARNAGDAARVMLMIGTALVLGLTVLSGYLLHRAVSRPLQESSTVLASTSTQILAAASEQAAGANETMAAVAQTVATVEEVALTAQQSSERARAVGASSEKAAELARNGRHAADASVAAMDAIRDQVDGTAQSILSLAERAQAISEIIATVDDLADQTNLLALNAAVEAARAGEAGRGFGVVAGEVRGLAEESKRATVQVRQILGEIQRATNAAVVATEKSTARALSGTQQATEAGEMIRALADAVSSSREAAAQIAASAGQQAVGMEQIRQAIANIQEATRQNLTASRQTESAAQDLNRLGRTLVDLVGGRVTT